MRIRLHWKLALLCGVAAGLGFILGQSAIAPRFFWAPPALIILGAAPLFFILFSRPLKMIIACTRSIANGDFLCRPKLRRNDEIGELGLAMAEMAEAISVRFEKIKQEAARAATVFSSMSEGVILTDEKGGILLINPSARKLFFLDTSVEGKIPLETLRNLVVQDTIDRVLQEDAGLVSEEIVLNHPAEKILKVNAVPVVSEGKIKGAVLVFHDITHLRRLEKVRQDFVANVSHELRTPIASIKGYAETLLGGALDDKANARDFINIIYQDSVRLANLIDDLLELSRIESAKMKMEFLPLELAPVVSKTLKVLEKAIQAKSLFVKTDIPEILPLVLADEKRLAQVFLNLLDNAVKYTSEKGSIRISAAVKDGYVQIDICDTGVGIPEKDLARIFERFYRVDKGRSRELGGTGLGLSIVKHIVLAHGGEVRVESVLGQGSTFSFTIPKA